MSEVKWIKIVTDIFDDEKILLIEALPERDSIIVIWFKLLCMAGKQNNGGVFLLNDRIAYTDEMLATIFRRPLNTVRLALQTFEQFGMVEIVNNTITIPNWEKHQSLDKIEKSKEQTRKRVAAFRERQKQIVFNGDDTCQYCGGKATGIDHIIPISRGGADTDDNRVQCCIECNRMKNDKPLVDFLNMHRERISDKIVLSNPKLTRHVTLCNVTGCYIVTECNADRIRIREEEDKEIDKEGEKKKTAKRFTPPTVDEVRAYCQERQNNVDAERFIDYYTSNGWKVGKNPMKDWKAAVRTWERQGWNGYGYGGPKPQAKPNPNAADAYSTARLLELLDENE